MENVRKHRGIKLLTTEARRNYLVSEPNYHTTILFFKETIGHKNEKNTQIFMRKLVYLGLSMLEISKALLHEFWYDYVKPKYGEKKVRIWLQLYSLHKNRRQLCRHCKKR